METRPRKIKLGPGKSSQRAGAITQCQLTGTAESRQHPMRRLPRRRRQRLIAPMTSILLVRLSSMGDLIHTWPALTDLQLHYPQARVDWVSEEGFAQLPSLHPVVNDTVPMAWRRWRRTLLQRRTRQEMRAFHQRLRAQTYDLVIDAQGLVKSAVVTAMARGLKAGYNRASAREALASLAYDKGYAVARGQHAVLRNRLLFGQIMGYTPEGPPVFGLRPTAPLPDWLCTEPYAVLLHATSRVDKEWDPRHWVQVGRELQQRGLRLVLPWGNAREQQRSRELAQQLPESLVPPGRLGLAQAASLLREARLTIGVDTGLTHLANAVDCPLLALYTATDPGLTGVIEGPRAVNLGGARGGPTPSQVLESALPWLERA